MSEGGGFFGGLFGGGGGDGGLKGSEIRALLKATRPEAGPRFAPDSPPEKVLAELGGGPRALGVGTVQDVLESPDRDFLRRVIVDQFLRGIPTPDRRVAPEVIEVLLGGQAELSPTQQGQLAALQENPGLLRMANRRGQFVPVRPAVSPVQRFDPRDVLEPIERGARRGLELAMLIDLILRTLGIRRDTAPSIRINLPGSGPIVVDDGTPPPIGGPPFGGSGGELEMPYSFGEGGGFGTAIGAATTIAQAIRGIRGGNMGFDLPMIDIAPQGTIPGGGGVCGPRASNPREIQVEHPCGGKPDTYVKAPRDSGWKVVRRAKRRGCR